LLGAGGLCASVWGARQVAAEALPNSPSAAQPAENRAKNKLLLTIAGSEPERAALTAVASELMARLGVAVDAEAAPELSLSNLRARDERDTPFLAHGFVDLTHAGRATLYLLDPARDRLLVRQLGHDQQDAELLREELAHILETSIEGLLSGAAIGEQRAHVLRELTPPTASPQAPPRAEKSASAPQLGAGRALRVAALYEAGLLASKGVLAHGPEGALLLQLPGAAQFGVWFSAQYRLPIHVTASPVSARLEGGALRLLGTVGTRLSKRAQLLGGVGAGVDLVRVQALASSADVTVAEPHWLSIATVRAGLALDLRVSTHISGLLALAADVDPQRTRYVLARDENDSAIFEPWLVRPSLIAGIIWP
jgi:hypothetical protein